MSIYRVNLCKLLPLLNAAVWIVVFTDCLRLLLTLMHVGDFLFFRMLQISVIQLVPNQSRASQSSQLDCCCGFVLAVAQCGADTLIAGLQDRHSLVDSPSSAVVNSVFVVGLYRIFCSYSIRHRIVEKCTIRIRPNFFHGYMRRSALRNANYVRVNDLKVECSFFSAVEV